MDYFLLNKGPKLLAYSSSNHCAFWEKLKFYIELLKSSPIQTTLDTLHQALPFPRIPGRFAKNIILEFVHYPPSNNLSIVLI
jgi:hypothetical protein